MTPEQEVLTDLLGQLDRIARSVAEDREVLGPPPDTLTDFQEMSPLARTASKALLKDFEQYADTAQRLIRTQLRATKFRLKGLTPIDIANKAEELEQVSDAAKFVRLIELRNDLTHEYPDDVATRFDRFRRALASFEFLDDVSVRLRQFAATRISDSEQ